jgi:hypothetical protein
MRRKVGAALFALTLIAAGARCQIAGHVVISELYGAGGNSGALLKNDFVELYNPTPYSVPLSGWSLQYASATGTGAWHASPLGGKILPYGFYLVQLAGGTNGISLPIPDTTGTLNLSATAGKVALVRSVAPLSGARPADSLIIDFIGYGDADGYEGSGPAPAASVTTSLERKGRPLATAASMAPGGADAAAGNGWDSNNNAADFVTQASPCPQNSASPVEKPPDDLLPIRFGTMGAAAGEHSPVVVTWSTISEIACYGFEVQRSGDPAGVFATISGFIPGHGTTIVTHFYSFTDAGGTAGNFYRVREIDTNGAEWYSDSFEATRVASLRTDGPRVYSLLRSYPNPFNPGTTISYSLAASGKVDLVIVDVLGRLVETLSAGNQTSGEHRVRWDAAGRPAGIYFCRLNTAKGVQMIRLALVR